MEVVTNPPPRSQGPILTLVDKWELLTPSHCERYCTTSQVADLSQLLPCYLLPEQSWATILSGLATVARPAPTAITWISAVLQQEKEGRRGVWYMGRRDTPRVMRHFISSHPQYLPYYAMVGGNLRMPTEIDADTGVALVNSTEVGVEFGHITIRDGAIATLIAARPATPERGGSHLPDGYHQTTPPLPATSPDRNLSPTTTLLSLPLAVKYGLLDRLPLTVEAVGSLLEHLGEIEARLRRRGSWGLVLSVVSRTLCHRLISGLVGEALTVLDDEGKREEVVQNHEMRDCLIALLSLYPTSVNYAHLVREHGVAGLLALLPDVDLNHIAGLPVEGRLTTDEKSRVIDQILTGYPLHSHLMADRNRARLMGSSEVLLSVGTRETGEQLMNYAPHDLVHTTRRRVVMVTLRTSCPPLLGREAMDESRRRNDLSTIYDLPPPMPLPQLLRNYLTRLRLVSVIDGRLSD